METDENTTIGRASPAETTITPTQHRCDAAGCTARVDESRHLVDGGGVVCEDCCPNCGDEASDPALMDRIRDAFPGVDGR
jgi:hypothetical protein